MSRLADTKPESPPRRSDSAMLQPGDLITHFNGATVDGREVPYDRFWQHRNVVLFVLPAELSAPASPYLRALQGRLSELKPEDTSLVVDQNGDCTRVQFRAAPRPEMLDGIAPGELSSK
jgi:hypothetical protein